MKISDKPAASRVLGSFQFAVDGLVTLFQTQTNARVHLAVAVGVILLAVSLRLPPLEIAILTLAIGFVLVVEALNTAVEFVVDCASPDYHPMAKQAKDVAAGAVLLSALTAVVVGAVLLGPRLLGAVGW